MPDHLAGYRHLDNEPTFYHHLSTEDTVSLSELSGTGQTQAWVSARIKEYSNRILALNTIYNAAAPINSMLPAELRLQIFENLKDNFRSQFAVLHVCRAWRWQLFHTPEFWVSLVERKHHLVRKKDIILFKLYLTLTASYPISLSLFELASPALQFEILSPHCHRITSLTVKISSSTEESLDILLKYGMAHLEHLDVGHHHLYDDLGRRSSLPLDRVSLPRLKSLVHPFRSWIETALDERLQHLSLYECYCESCSQLSRIADFTFMDLLSRCTSLRTLVLRGVLSSLPPSPHTIILPPVRTLRIVDPLLVTTRDNILDLSYPSTSFVSLHHHPLRSNVHPDFPKEFISSYPHLAEIDEVHLMFPVVDLIPGRAPNAFFEQGETHVVKAYARGAQRLHICVPFIDVGGSIHTMELLRAFTARATVTTLAIDISAYHYTIQEARDLLGMVLAELPELRRLDVGRLDARYHILPFLSSPEMYPALTGGPLCPQLQTLAVVWRQAEDPWFSRFTYETLRTMDVPTPQPPEAPLNVDVEVGFAVLCALISRLLSVKQSTDAPLRKMSVRVVERSEAGAVIPGWELPQIEAKLQEKFNGLLSEGIELLQLVEC